MKAVSKKKLCWNCEGEVLLQAQTCPYCAAELEENLAAKEELETEEQAFTFPSRDYSQQTLIDSQNPYSGTYSETQDNTPARSQELAEEMIPTPPYQAKQEESFSQAEWEGSMSQGLAKEEKEVYEGEFKKTLLPLLLLTMGSSFFLFSLVLLLFSEDGYLALHWSADKWLYFMLLGVPASYFGWKLLEQSEEKAS